MVLTSSAWQTLNDASGAVLDEIRIDSWNADTIDEFLKERLA